MATESDIRERLQAMAGSYAPDVSNIARVKSVNEQECTCTLEDEDGLPFYDVRLRPVTGKNKSLLQIPKAGSLVLAMRIESSEEWMVVACDQVEKLQLIVGESQIVVTENDILMNGGTLGGLVKISELTAKLNEFINVFNTHSHIVATTGTAAAQSGTATPTQNIAQPLNKTDYEDQAVKH